jgi:hypothetical protein
VASYGPNARQIQVLLDAISKLDEDDREDLAAVWREWVLPSAPGLSPVVAAQPALDAARDPDRTEELKAALDAALDAFGGRPDPREAWNVIEMATYGLVVRDRLAPQTVLRLNEPLDIFWRKKWPGETSPTGLA